MRSERLDTQLEDQDGLITRDQARRAGCSTSSIDRRLKSGEWEIVTPSVYRLVGSPRTRRQSIRAFVLANAPMGAASHRSAASLWGMPVSHKGPVDVLVPGTARREHKEVIVHRSLCIPPQDIRHVAGIRTTAPARTLIDLAAVARRPELESCVDDALRRRLVSYRALLNRFEDLSGRGRPGCALLRDVLGLGPVDVGLERRFLKLLKANGIPLPSPQHNVRANGRWLGRVDFAYPEARLAIELDGRSSHDLPEAFEGDRARDSRLGAAGWHTMRVTSKRLRTEPHEIVHELISTLHWRSSPG